jgi:hypothetical protein
MVFDFHNQAPKSVCQIIAFSEPFDVDTPFVFSKPGSAKGTGFIVNVNNNLLIFTAAHVVHFAQDVVCVLAVGKADRRKLKIVHFIPDFDVAILTFVHQDDSIRNLIQPISLGDDTVLTLGEKIFAIGYPLGDQQLKVVPAHFNGRRQWLQIDGAMNQGISGGPVIMKNGNVIGIVVKGIAPEKVNNVTIAVPISIIKNFFHLFDPAATNKILPVVHLGIRYLEPTIASVEKYYKGNEGAQVGAICSISPLYQDLNSNDLIQKISLTINGGNKQSFIVDKYGMVFVSWQKQPLPVTYVFDQMVPQSLLEMEGVRFNGDNFVIKKEFPKDINEPTHPWIPRYAWTLDESRSEYFVFAGMILQNMSLELANQFKYVQSPMFIYQFNQPFLIISYILDATELGKNRSIVRPGDIIVKIGNTIVQNVKQGMQEIMKHILKNPPSTIPTTSSKMFKKLIDRDLSDFNVPTSIEFTTLSGITFVINVSEQFIKNEIKQADKWGIDEKILFPSDVVDLDQEVPKNEEEFPDVPLSWIEHTVDTDDFERVDVLSIFNNVSDYSDESYD